MAKKQQHDHSIYILALIAIVAVATISMQGNPWAQSPPVIVPVDPIGNVQVDYIPPPVPLDAYDTSIPVYEQSPALQGPPYPNTNYPYEAVGDWYPDSDAYGAEESYGARFSSAGMTRQQRYGLREQTPYVGGNTFSGYGENEAYGSRFYTSFVDRGSAYKPPLQPRTDQVPDTGQPRVSG
ncbi:hypothetical protein CMO91_04020 [Candidatus Woesearchaeota archaeon]|nr:hypothetical protein [Candidatus Woesearchaeota archaeon]|tara:strand:+ start:126 stop:668 length:543 start_codon:yes stop_codon:yes gene_type:complete